MENHARFKGVMDNRNLRKNLFWMRHWTFSSPFSLGPCVVSNLKTRRVFLWIPLAEETTDVEKAKHRSTVWLFWHKAGAAWNPQENRFEFDITGKNIAEWLKRAIERVNAL